MPQIETERLILREWKSEDLAPFTLMNEDPKVMEYFLSPLTEMETVAMVERIREHFTKHGFGLFACTLKETSEFMGFVGLSVPTFETSFTPCVEIGWRLSCSAWGKGYATEAALAVLKFGFEECKLQEILSWTAPANARSRNVMEKIGLTQEGNFDHPKVPEGHPFKSHVLYRMTKKQYESR